ncbi:unnamed protein product, partial [Effrenium voratum]
MLWQLIVLLCSDMILAGRPAHHDVLDDDLTLHRVRGKCPQEVPLRAVLTQLGLKDVENVYENDCDVRTIYLPVRKVHGTLDERIAELTELYYLHLGHTNVTGDLEVLAKNRKLGDLRLQRTRVTGDLRSLSQAKGLRRLYLHRTQVTGDLASLSQATGLAHLDLHNTRVTGDLSDLSQATGLTNLYLQNTQVAGDLSSLAQATRLVHLNLQNTRVTGDLSGLSQVTGLRYLRLRNTQVAGDLSGLSQATGLISLHLGNTRVTGDLSGLPQPTGLKVLHVQNTQVAGNISALHSWSKLQTAELSWTQVSGRIDRSWLGHCQQLKTLKLAETKVSVRFDGKHDRHACALVGDCLLPKLATLDLSGCPLNCAVAEFFHGLKALPSLTTLKAANAGLTGEIRTEDLKGVQAAAVDLSSNKLTHVAALPPRCQSFAAASNDCTLAFGKRVLGKAFSAGISVNLWNVTFEPESAHLLDRQFLSPTERRAVYNEDRGFACYDVLPTNFRISPELFAPERLCSCLPGWRNGSGATCQQCPKNTFKDSFEGTCQQCPEGSQAAEGAKSLMQCQCKIGEVFNESGVPRCGCPRDEVQKGDLCAKCDELNWNCSEPGSEVLSARPLPGFARLGNQTRAFKCFPPDERCSSNESAEESGCFIGYTGILCGQCRPGFYSSGDACERCTTALILPNVHYAWYVAGCAVILALVGGLLWNQGQLWSVVAMLSSQEEGSDNIKEQLPKNFAFRSAIPEILCDEESSFKAKVDMVAYITAFGYAVVVPCCLLYLYARQHFLLRRSRTITVNATQEDDLKVTLRPVLKSGKPTPEKHDQWTRHTAASTAAYISLTFRGPLSLKMEEGEMVVQMLEGCSLTHGEVEMNISDVGTFLDEDEAQQARILRCRAISEMLMERCTLHEVAASERILLGAKDLLSKYAFGRNVFMEIVQKLVAMALVSTVSSPDGLQQALGITLGMAAMVALVQPYLKPQANTLLACCYLCLAMAAWAFHRRVAWLSRAALALPFLLAWLQSLTPDGAEIRALRIWE